MLEKRGKNIYIVTRIREEIFSFPAHNADMMHNVKIVCSNVPWILRWQKKEQHESNLAPKDGYKIIASFKELSANP